MPGTGEKDRLQSFQGEGSGHVPRIIIGAPQGRSGKTTVTLGLLRALNRMGVAVQPFKKGPDYIDPSWHRAAAGRDCRNLDSYFMSPEQIRSSLLKASQGSALTVIEGAMGLFDGIDLAGSTSTAEIAKITGSPVILVVDATRMTRSVAALVKGYQTFDPGISVVGVILNKVARARQEKLMREAIEMFCGLPVLGALPKEASVSIPDRHLGLVTQEEMAEAVSLVDGLADLIQKHVDLAAVCALAEKAPKLPATAQTTAVQTIVALKSTPDSDAITANSAVLGERVVIGNHGHRSLSDLGSATLGQSFPVRIGVLRDRVFSFYYPENLQALRQYGAELLSINSLTDSCLPEDLDGLYIGGGFPEVFAAELGGNRHLCEDIRCATEAGLPVYAECGGLMYLGRSLQVNGQTFAMVGALPLDTVMEAKPQGHGYTSMEVLKDNPWFSGAQSVRGHEFHHSRIVNLDPKVRFGLRVERGFGIDGEHDGILYRGIYAAYNHIHVLSCPTWASSFVNLAGAYHQVRWGNKKWAAGE
ncbi:MAG: cobyrinate a,c-diamide synthase [Desulfitobacteriaceae bacterium]|nr:cobyrinate a,c-diamide synthase [Desulfitobacteriaceae bacterium]MDI6878700.1 cobyrinate a,c-diamide synthase [Desulfitobacteriaceae bacterium]MDI6914117.1 cobyrinate a,c-diamide synthase [Desulfitobacteriaceae bacterium]